MMSLVLGSWTSLSGYEPGCFAELLGCCWVGLVAIELEEEKRLGYYSQGSGAKISLSGKVKLALGAGKIRGSC